MKTLLVAMSIAAASSLIDDAKNAVMKRLRNPSSAQFEDVRLSQGASRNGKIFQVVCGTVNAKNRYGAYAGRAPFVYFIEDATVYIAAHFEIIEGPAVDQYVAPRMQKRYCAQP